MARPGFRNHPKFLRLCKLLDMPPPHVYGHVEFLWSVAYETGNPVVGDSLDVEIASDWRGKSQVLTCALMQCGGPGRAGLIEPTQDNPDIFQIHDLHEHAPEYVRHRRSKEDERGVVKCCENCGCEYHSSEKHSKFCTSHCRVEHHRKQQKETDGNGDVRNTCNDVTRCNAPPAPAPAPAPPTINTPKSSAHQSTFDAWWRWYPRKVGKKAAKRAYERAITEIGSDLNRPLGFNAAEFLLERVQQFCNTPKGKAKSFCPHPSTWLNEGRYDDDPETWNHSGDEIKISHYGHREPEAPPLRFRG